MPVAKDNKQGNVVWPVLAAAVLLLFHVFSDSAATTMTQRLYGWLLGAFAVAAGWRYWSLKLFHRRPVIELALAELYIFFGIPTTTDSLSRYVNVSEDGVSGALLACVLFAVATVLTSELGRRTAAVIKRPLRAVLPSSLGDGGAKVAPGLVVMPALVNMGMLWLVPASVRFLVTVVSDPAGAVAYFAVGDDSRTNTRAVQLKRARNVLLCGGLIAIAGLPSGMLSQMIRPFVLGLVVWTMIVRRIPARWLAMALLVFLILNPAKQAFRASQGWGDFDKHHDSRTQLFSSPTAALGVWADALETSWFGNSDVEQNTRDVADRINLLTSVARTIDFSGRRVPYDLGSRWILIARSVIPRFLDAEKPQMTVEFNDRFNYLFSLQSAYGARNTTVTLPVIADGYWNFGWFGVALMGAITGFVWGTISNLWDPHHWGISWLALALFARVSVGASFYGTIAGIPSICVGTGCAAWLIYGLAKLFGTSRHSGRAGRPLRP